MSNRHAVGFILANSSALDILFPSGHRLHHNPNPRAPAKVAVPSLRPERLHTIRSPSAPACGPCRWRDATVGVSGMVQVFVWRSVVASRLHTRGPKFQNRQVRYGVSSPDTRPFASHQHWRQRIQVIRLNVDVRADRLRKEQLVFADDPVFLDGSRSLFCDRYCCGRAPRVGHAPSPAHSHDQSAARHHFVSNNAKVVNLAVVNPNMRMRHGIQNTFQQVVQVTLPTVWRIGRDGHGNSAFDLWLPAQLLQHVAMNCGPVALRLSSLIK